MGRADVHAAQQGSRGNGLAFPHVERNGSRPSFGVLQRFEKRLVVENGPARRINQPGSGTQCSQFVATDHMPCAMRPFPDKRYMKGEHIRPLEQDIQREIVPCRSRRVGRLRKRRVAQQHRHAQRGSSHRQPAPDVPAPHNAQRLAFERLSPVCRQIKKRRQYVLDHGIRVCTRRIGKRNSALA